ncbi:hypothetical protein R1sor_013975 [Riccia sorocarpa]|uniref:Uncharacterized protein n=1 Tax=Riccia sorocarpa TaxID=122646 RepID=A0ABD3H9Y2_9MARC
MPSLIWEDEEILSGEREMLDYIHNFYSELYKQPPITLSDRHGQSDVLDLIDKFVMQEQNTQMIRLPKEKELDKLVTNLPEGKSQERTECQPREWR